MPLALRPWWQRRTIRWQRCQSPRNFAINVGGYKTHIDPAEKGMPRPRGNIPHPTSAIIPNGNDSSSETSTVSVSLNISSNTLLVADRLRSEVGFKWDNNDVLPLLTQMSDIKTRHCVLLRVEAALIPGPRIARFVCRKTRSRSGLGCEIDAGGVFHHSARIISRAVYSRCRNLESNPTSIHNKLCQ
jgi:hypothetical protein